MVRMHSINDSWLAGRVTDGACTAQQCPMPQHISGKRCIACLRAGWSRLVRRWPRRCCLWLPPRMGPFHALGVPLTHLDL